MKYTHTDIYKHFITIKTKLTHKKYKTRLLRLQDYKSFPYLIGLKFGKDLLYIIYKSFSYYSIVIHLQDYKSFPHLSLSLPLYLVTFLPLALLIFSNIIIFSLIHLLTYTHDTPFISIKAKLTYKDYKTKLQIFPIMQMRTKQISENPTCN